jgi:hypothetical protein
MGELGWQRSTRCDSVTCVEVAMLGERIAVRDGKAPDGAILFFSPAEWAAFVAGVKAGEFDPEIRS